MRQTEHESENKLKVADCEKQTADDKRRKAMEKFEETQKRKED